MWAEAKLKRERETGSGGVTVANISELERVLLDRSLCVGRGEREEAWEEGSGQMPLLQRKALGWEWGQTAVEKGACSSVRRRLRLCSREGAGPGYMCSRWPASAGPKVSCLDRGQWGGTRSLGEKSI